MNSTTLRSLSIIIILLLVASCKDAINNQNTKTVKDDSVSELWTDFVQHNPNFASITMPESWYFCDNEKDADECAQLVIDGIKQATSSSLWWYQTNHHPLPQKGDLYIVTNWKGKAKAIIQTTQVEKVAFNKITEEYAAIEGEGDKSLAYWKKVHWDYYTREMQEKGESPTEDMIIVCEQFKAIWTNNTSNN